MAPERHVPHPAVGIKFQQAGVSLLEFVIGLVLLAIILLGVTLFFASQHRQLDPVFQFRAVSLAEAVAEQVLAIKYDVKNDPQSQTRCVTCTDPPTPVAGSKLTDFAAVEDFNHWCEDGAIAGNILADQLNLTRTQLYARYTVQTCVKKGNNGTNNYKEVTITIADQNGADLSFTLHRYNIR